MHWAFLSLYFGLLIVVRVTESQDIDSNVVAEKILHAKAISIEAYQRQLAAYWTTERKNAAKPMKFPTFNSKKNGTGRLTEHVNKNADEKTVIIDPESPWKNITRGRLLDASLLATKITGKVFFTQGFYDYVCSASVVTSPSRSLVITAGHCVYDVDYDVWSTNWMFVPAYDDGDEPFGTWTAKALYASKSFTTASNFDSAANFDVGFAVMYPSGGRRIAQVVGSYGIAFNYRRTGISYSFGYPVDIGDGEIMSSCMGRLLSENCYDASFLGQSRRCGMTGGSSGGPWLQLFNDKTGLGTITSLTSFTCSSTPYVLYGPSFDNGIRTLYNAVRSLT